MTTTATTAAAAAAAAATTTTTTRARARARFELGCLAWNRVSRRQRKGKRSIEAGLKREEGSDDS
jgi:hypothetical protein